MPASEGGYFSTAPPSLTCSAWAFRPQRLKPLFKSYIVRFWRVATVISTGNELPPGERKRAWRAPGELLLHSCRERWRSTARCVVASGRIDMKHLLTGVVMVAGIALAAPTGAQTANPSGGNSMGLPGPSPGGPGLTPYSTGTATPAATPSGPTSTGGRRTSGERIPAIAPETSSPPSSASDTTSATPPARRQARAHHVASHHPSRFPNVQGNNSANELNQAELSRLQSGNFTPPAPPEISQEAPAGSAGPMHASPSPQPNRMPAGGRATSGAPGGH
jgi:hypothetical protein